MGSEAIVTETWIRVPLGEADRKSRPNEVDPVCRRSRVAFCISSPRNHFTANSFARPRISARRSLPVAGKGRTVSSPSRCLAISPWLGPARASRGLRGARADRRHEPVAQQTTKVRTRVQFPLTPCDNPSRAIPTVHPALGARIPAPDLTICTFGGAWRLRAWRESNPRPTA